MCRNSPRGRTQALWSWDSDAEVLCSLLGHRSQLALASGAEAAAESCQAGGNAPLHTGSDPHKAQAPLSPTPATSWNSLVRA